MSTGHAVPTRETVNLPPGMDRLPSGSIRVRVYGPGGKRHPVGTYRTLKEAKDAQAKARTELLGGNYIERKRSDITLDQWVESEWMPARRVRPNTLHKDQERYRLHVKPYLGGLSLIALTDWQVDKWLGNLERDGRKPPTIKKAHTLLKTALNAAIGDRRLSANPCVVVKCALPERPRWKLLTRPQFDVLLDDAPEWLRLPMLLAAFGGLRWSEIAGLQARDYDRTQLTISRGLTYTPKQGLRVGLTKGRRTRQVPLPPRVRDALNQHLKEHPTVGEGWLFTLEGKPIAPYRQTHAWANLTEKTGIACRFHDLRHSCASWLLAAGATTAEVRDHLGHASITTTEEYLHIDEAAFADKISAAFG